MPIKTDVLIFKNYEFKTLLISFLNNWLRREEQGQEQDEWLNITFVNYNAPTHFAAGQGLVTE